MSIIIHFNTASFIPSSVALPSASSCISRAKTKLTMVPGIDQTDRTVMTDDENSMVDIATSNTLYTHAINDLKSNHVFGSCFGLPYQDHNYGAPPPPTPPSYSPCNSPPHANGVPDEDTNLSVVSTSTANEETQDASITRCICGFEHDDEYMICCDNCLVWQHVDCMGLDRNNIPETYLCEKCQPRKVDRHKAKVLQTRKKIRMTDSSDSDDDHGKNSEKKSRTRSKRRRKEEDKTDKSEHRSSRRSRNLQKHKERMEAKSARLRRTKNKESTSTADEEAQDAWEISLEWCEKNFETAITNQYTPEVQHLARTLPIQGHERRFMELLVTKHCKIVDGNQKRLISIYDIPRNQPLIEYVGKFLLASQFYELHPAFSKRLFPFVTFYSLDQEEICVDASVYGNEARFVRRSCKPNAELHHLVHNGNLHLYISSTKAVFKDDEITLPLDFNLKESIKDMECACESDDCILKFHQKNSCLDINEKRKKVRKLTFSADDDSSHSFVGANVSPTKSKPSPAKSASQTSDHTDGKSDHETEEQANERKKKTREERKIDAIMRAFDQMEKAAKRRQQALERQKAHHPKSEESSDKPEPAPIPKEEDKVTTASGSETQGGEDEKVHIPTPKPKKGKRRRGSGTSRRRTRTNSGGSDILSPEESVQPKTVPTITSEIAENPETNLETLNETTSCSTPTSVASVSSAVVTPLVLKTKRLLLHEWLQQEKSETNTNPPATTPPVAVRTEVKWSPTCYVQCTKDNPHSSGISAAHLRRSSTSGPIKSYPIKSCSEQGSAKKRWLRQAMYDNNTYDDTLLIDPGGMDILHLDNDELSPDGQGEMGSPDAADDTVTPLKKRRLMRESLESTSSPLSPAPHSSEGTNSVLSLTINEIKVETESDTMEQLSTVEVDSPYTNLTLKLKENIPCEVKNIKVECESPKKLVTQKEESASDSPMKSSLSLEPSPLVETPNATVLSECTVVTVEPSMQIICDPAVKNSNTVKNEDAQGHLDLLLQNNSNDNNVEQSVHVCSNENIQSNLLTLKISMPVAVQTVLNESTTPTNSVKRKIIFSSEQCNTLPCIASEDNSSCTQEMQSDSLESKNKVSVPVVEGTSFGTEVEHSPIKSEECVNKVLSDNSSVLPVHFDGTKDNFSDPASQSPKLHTSVHPVKNVNASVNVSLDCRSEQVNNVDTPKKILTDVSIAEPEILCCNSSSPDHVNSNHEKSEEYSDLDCKFTHLSNENSSSAVKATCASATQKRKVSLSEYRMRMKDGTSKRTYPEAPKRSTSSSSVSATAIPETLPEQVTLAPLPLFDTSTGSQSPPQPTPVKSSKTKKEAVKIEESFSDVIEHRENLTERLKREFGFDEDSDDCILTSNSTNTINGGASSALPSNAQQPPPPPPPPPPRPSRPLQSGMSITAAAVSPSQFGFSMQTPYARSSYIVPQVPSAQFIPVQQPVTASIIPSIHPATTPRMQHNVRTPLLQSPHSFASSLPGNIHQPPIQHEYSSVNAQNYAALVQQPPPPPPPPKSYSHVYQPGLYN